jgi:hypothetical protein
MTERNRAYALLTGETSSVSLERVAYGSWKL